MFAYSLILQLLQKVTVNQCKERTSWLFFCPLEAGEWGCSRLSTALDSSGSPVLLLSMAWGMVRKGARSLSPFTTAPAGKGTLPLVEEEASTWPCGVWRVRHYYFYCYYLLLLSSLLLLLKCWVLHWQPDVRKNVSRMAEEIWIAYIKHIPWGWCFEDITKAEQLTGTDMEELKGACFA